MATPFTSTQKAKLRLYMGWSARFHQFDSALEQAFSAIDSEPDDSTHDILVQLVVDLDDIQVRIKDAYSRLKAKVVGSITLPSHDEIAMLRSEGRRLVGQVSATFGTPVRHDIFKGSGFRMFAGFDGLYGGDNAFRHG
jgi:hypothetical protein